MSAGFVYVMINPAMRGLVKIGLSKKTSKARAKSMKTTGVPDDFIIVFDELVTDCECVEARLHQRFTDYRYQPNRAFFQIPIREAIRGLMEESEDFIVPRIDSNSGVEILPDLKRKYPAYLKPDFHSIKIVHIGGVVYLDSLHYRHVGLRDEVVERTDLVFIGDEGDDGEMFPSSRSPIDNARLFVHELEEFSMMHCTDLFTHEACEEITRRHKNR